MTAPGWLTVRPIAHRGLHDRAAGRCENSLAAAEAAIAGGFGIECDVQVSADGDAMVFHDGDLDRLTPERGPVRERRAAELERLPLGGTADTIPTLAAFLDRIAGRVPVTVEVKSRFDGDETLLRRVAAVLRDRDEPIALKTFDPAVLAALDGLVPGRPRGIVGKTDWSDDTVRPPGAADRLPTLSHWDETRPDFISWRGRDLPGAAPVAARRATGVPVMAWTIRSPAEAATARAGADQIVFEGFVPA